MLDLKQAINIVELIVAVVVVLLIGDYIGYKIGRLRLATASAVIVLLVVVAFAIYAAIVLTR